MAVHSSLIGPHVHFAAPEQADWKL